MLSSTQIHINALFAMRRSAMPLVIFALLIALTSQASAQEGDGGQSLWYGDTYAQWAVAVTGIAAFLLSVWAVWLLKLILDATRAAVTVTEEIGYAQTRPYLGIPSINIESIDHTPPRLRLHIQNFGHSIALDVNCRVTHFRAPRRGAEIGEAVFDRERPPQRYPFMVFGGELRGTSFDLADNPNETLFVAISLTYRDSLNRQYRTRKVFRTITRDGGKTFGWEDYGKYARAT